MGATVEALDGEFRTRWTLTARNPVDEAWSLLTTRGDLLVHTSAGEVMAIATGAPGPPSDGWPMGPGDERNARAR